MRYRALDIWRGIACIGMFIFHVEAIRIFVFMASSNWIFEWPGLLLGQFVRISFLLLVGTSTWIIYDKYKGGSEFKLKQFNRFLKVGLVALLVTGISYAIVPRFFIVFGILHLIALSNLLMIPLARLNKYICVLLGIALIAAGNLTYSLDLGIIINFLLGQPFDSFVTFDYFPLVPWFGYVLIGFGAGKFIIDTSEKIIFFKPKQVELLGKRALEFYVFHLALIYLFWNVVLISVKS
jgi:uncharacterized membrane protein